MSLINVIFVRNKLSDSEEVYGRFDDGRNFSAPASVARIVVCDEEYTLNIYVASKHDEGWKEFIGMEKLTVIIFSFSIVEPNSYRQILELWRSPALLTSIKADVFEFTRFPILLVGSGSELRDNESHLFFLNAIGEEAITTEMGKQLARRINAAKYLECSSSAETGLESLYEEIVWTSIRQVERKIPNIKLRGENHVFGIVVVGTNNLVTTDLIERFAFGERLDVLGEFLNEQPYFYEDFIDSHSTTFIELNGESFELNILPIALNNPFALGKLSRSRVYTIVFAFSIADLDSYNAITTTLVEEIQAELRFGSPFSPPSPILVGCHADLRNNAKFLKKLSKIGQQPLTFEMGEDLARKINAERYLECASSDVIEIKKVFEEAVWSSIREFEKIRHTYEEYRRLTEKLCSLNDQCEPKQGFFKRFFKRLR